jgi:hypothetical protein
VQAGVLERGARLRCEHVRASPLLVVEAAGGRGEDEQHFLAGPLREGNQHRLAGGADLARPGRLSGAVDEQAAGCPGCIDHRREDDRQKRVAIVAGAKRFGDELQPFQLFGELSLATPRVDDREEQIDDDDEREESRDRAEDDVPPGRGGRTVDDRLGHHRDEREPAPGHSPADGTEGRASDRHALRVSRTEVDRARRRVSGEDAAPAHDEQARSSRPRPGAERSDQLVVEADRDRDLSDRAPAVDDVHRMHEVADPDRRTGQPASLHPDGEAGGVGDQPGELRPVAGGHRALNGR